MNSDNDKIEAFWNWFEQNENFIKYCIENEHAEERSNLIEMINNQVLDFGLFKWDIGINDQDEWFFLISPNSDKDRLKLSQRIMNQAPSHLSWELHSFKPATNWDRIALVYNDELELQEIDTSSWHYVAFKEKDGSIELIFEAQSTYGLTNETLEEAVGQFLLNEIGEKIMTLYISKFSVVNELDPEDALAKYSIEELKDHLSDLGDL